MAKCEGVGVGVGGGGPFFERATLGGWQSSNPLWTAAVRGRICPKGRRRA